MEPSLVDRIPAPDDHDHHHDGREFHDPHRFFAGFFDSLDVLPPEIGGHQDREDCGGGIGGKRVMNTDSRENLVEESNQILTSGDAADGPGEHIVEHERRD